MLLLDIVLGLLAPRRGVGREDATVVKVVEAEDCPDEGHWRREPWHPASGVGRRYA